MKYQTISVAQAKTLIAEKNPLILDCRSISDYRAGHLENALHLHQDLKESVLNSGDKQRYMLIYCYHGHASEHLAEFFSVFGFVNVYSMAGGYTAWQQQESLCEA